MTQQNQTAEIVHAPINPAILPMVPETLLIASEPALWEGMKRIVQMYGRNLPQGVDAGTAVLLMLAAKEYGLNPLEGISNLFFIGGRIVPSANTMMRLATGNGLTIKPIIESAEEWTAEFSRPGRETITQTYTIEMAKRAQLVSGQVWQKNPQFMLRARCVSAAIRLYAGDLVKGIEYSAEELTNGSGYFDPNGDFTPDPSVVGTNPTAKDFKVFEGRASDQVTEKAAPAPAAKKPAQTRSKADVTAQVAEDLGKPAQTPAAAQEEAPAEDPMQAPGVDGKVITLARGQRNMVDFDATVRNIFAMLVQVEGDETKARAKATELMKSVNVKSTAELKGKITFIQFFLAADAYCASKLAAPAPQPTADDGIPAFDPHRGARTKAAGEEVADADPAQTENLDATIMDLFTELAGMGMDEAATAITEDTGYSDQAEASPASIKLDTIARLKDLKLEGIKQAS